MRKVIFIGYGFILLFISSLTGQTNPTLVPAKITSYDIDEGLLSSTVMESFTDREGRLWLNPGQHQLIHQTFDFYHFNGTKAIKPSARVKDSLDINSQLKLLAYIEAQNKFLGYTLNNHYFFFFDPESFEFTFFELEENEEAISGIIGPDGQIYVHSYSDEYLHYYKIEDNQLLKLGNVKHRRKRVRTVHFKKLFIKDGYIWKFEDVQTNKLETEDFINFGLVRFNIENGSSKYFDWKDFNFEPGRKVESHEKMLIDVNESKILLFIGSLNDLYHIDLNALKVKPYLPFRSFYNLQAGDKIETLKTFQDKVGNRIIRGIISPNSGKDSFFYTLIDKNGKLYDLAPVVKECVNTTRYNTLEEYFNVSGTDFTKQMTLGLEGGLVIVDIKPRNAIQTFLEDLPMRSIIELSDQQFFILTSFGPYQLDTKAKTTKQIDYSDFCLSNNGPLHFNQMEKDEEGNVWIPSVNRLVKYIPAKDTCISYPVGVAFSKFVFVSQTEVLLVSNRQEVLWYDFEKRVLLPVKMGRNSLITGGEPNHCIKTRDGKIWIASLGGLYQLNPKTKAVKQYDQKIGFPDRRIMCIYEDDTNRLWLGTYTGGIIIFDPSTEHFQIIDKKQGLSNNTVVGILEDDQGHIWASTFDGITILDKEGTIKTKLYKEEGLSNKEFNRFSFLKTNSGKLIFGTVKGLNIFDTKALTDFYLQRDTVKMYLTKIEYFDRRSGERVVLNNSKAFEERLSIPFSKRSIVIDFGISSLQSPGSNKFAYKLEGSDTDWIDIGDDNHLILSDLPFGSYNILIKGINYKGQLVEEPLSIPVKVFKSFYDTSIFYFLVSTPFLILFLSWLYISKTENQRLQNQIELATKEIKEDKRLIEEQTKELKSLDELKSRFFTNISHEFRNPITIIMGTADRIYKSPNEWATEGAKSIYRNANQLLLLVNQILELGKLESDKLSVDLVEGDIVRYLHYVTESYRSLAEFKNIHLHFLPFHKEIITDYDPKIIMHLLSNLITNAIKFTPEGGNVYVQVLLDGLSGKYIQKYKNVSPPVKCLTIKVRDTGIGIPKSETSKIFNRFYQIKNGINDISEGTGIGLAMTKELVELLEGNIAVESNVGIGTTFEIKLPAVQSGQVAKESIVNKPLVLSEIMKESSLNRHSEHTTLPWENKTINPDLPLLLYVEDNFYLVKYLFSVLKNDFNIVVAKDGKEGLEMVNSMLPDIILCDIVLPKMNGYDVCQKIRSQKETKHIPIIFLTSKADLESKIDGLKKGADAYLVKPFMVEELKTLAENLIDTRNMLKETYQKDPYTSNEEKTADDFLYNIKQTIESNIDNPLFGIPQLCRAVGLSRSQLYKKLKAATGLSTSIFIRSVKLDKAKELLKKTDLNVSEVAFKVGFKDPKYFSKLYIEAFDELPSETSK